MADKFMSMKNLGFTLHSRNTRYKVAIPDYLNEHTPKTIDRVFAAAFDLGKKVLHPMFEEMDRFPPQLVDGRVCVHKGVRPMLETLGQDGWIAATFPETWEGENMPSSLLLCINFIFATANYSASVYAGLTMGAAKLILSFGSDKLQNTYLPPLLAGKWQGTMALTEPEAGTSLGDLCTQAVPLEQGPSEKGQYKIFGEKIFISAGDHDGVDNVVHLILARIKGAPAGVKGISLFVVPKFRPDAQGNLVENDVVVTQVFHKLGYRGAPITGIRLGEKDNCIGYLVGQEHKGLAYMFQMMNNARLEVGMGATAIATAAYHSALDYCRTRVQGRPVTAPKNAAPIPIIGHADVRRMLLFQRSVAEGALALILQCGMYEDILAKDPGQTDCHLLLELLTPVAKTFPSEMGILSTSAAIQCFGGYGYCDDFPVEQHFRDMRIHTIHEGTTGIQAMDLLGRKLVMENGRALGLLKQEMEAAMAAASLHPESARGLEEMARDLAHGMALLEKTLQTLGRLAMEKGPEAYLADASLFLEMFGILVIAWQWLTMADGALSALEQENLKKKDTLFYEGKLCVARYFFAYELPKMQGLAKTLGDSAQMTLTLQDAWFTD
ncbi:MAG: acyl-CoA dehydrogenase [Proteobacteria bacterium]|nr:acyl-CoA dehydrogenase [Desulfobacula sp.]MBU3954571.1 acyl-CoA dehydrogenase [Pseudomonadota bacterium]MBU4131153.1 acyl-CoA dehydrogenase [Pseudomonadota bacterium]